MEFGLYCQGVQKGGIVVSRLRIKALQIVIKGRFKKSVIVPPSSVAWSMSKASTPAFLMVSGASATRTAAAWENNLIVYLKAGSPLNFPSCVKCYAVEPRGNSFSPNGWNCKPLVRVFS